MPAASGLHPNSTCEVGAGDMCEGDMYQDITFPNKYGWERTMPDDAKPPGANNKTAVWVVSYTKPNLHDQYDAMVVYGYAYANAYVRTYTQLTVPEQLTADDAAANWPAKRCTDDAPWSSINHNYCFEDQSQGCTDTAAECSTLGLVTAESCRDTATNHYMDCPCTCSAKATCTALPAPVDLNAPVPTLPPAPVTTHPTSKPIEATATPAHPVICVDNDDAIREIAFEYGVDGVAGCVAVRSRSGKKYCNNPRVKEACCISCQCRHHE